MPPPKYVFAIVSPIASCESSLFRLLEVNQFLAFSEFAKRGSRILGACMEIDARKLTLALSALWIVAAIPISQHFYDRVLDGEGFLMRIFAMLVICAPVWLVYGWRWLANGASIPAPIWLGVFGIAVIAFLLMFISDGQFRGWNVRRPNTAYIPVLCFAAFTLIALADMGRLTRRR